LSTVPRNGNWELANCDAVYAAIAMAVATVAHPVIAWAFTLLLDVAATMVTPGAEPAKYAVLRWLAAVYYLLPSTNVSRRNRFLTIKRASLRQSACSEHVVTLAYGLDDALVFLMIVMWSFHYRRLTAGWTRLGDHALDKK
jgi:hypothetical protein